MTLYWLYVGVSVSKPVKGLPNAGAVQEFYAPKSLPIDMTRLAKRLAVKTLRHFLRENGNPVPSEFGWSVTKAIK